MNYEDLMNKAKRNWQKSKQLRMDAGDDEGKWITTENGHHLHLNAKGEIDKGNPHVVKAVRDYPNDRKAAALKMHKSKEIPADVLGQLDTHNYSDEILDRAVDRKWITKEQASSIRSAKSESEKTKSSSSEYTSSSFKGKSYKEICDTLDSIPEGTTIKGIKDRYWLEKDPEHPIDTTIKNVEDM